MTGGCSAGVVIVDVVVVIIMLVMYDMVMR